MRWIAGTGAAIEFAAPEACVTGSATALAGAMIEVGCSVAETSAVQRITLAKANQAIFTWITAVPAAGGLPLSMPVPAEPGACELRFLDATNREVPARRVITVD